MTKEEEVLDALYYIADAIRENTDAIKNQTTAMQIITRRKTSQ